MYVEIPLLLTEYRKIQLRKLRNICVRPLKSVFTEDSLHKQALRTAEIFQNKFDYPLKILLFVIK